MNILLKEELWVTVSNKTRLTRAGWGWVDRCTQCGMSAGPWLSKTDAQVSALLHWHNHHAYSRYPSS